MIAVLVILSVKRSYHNANLNVEKLTSVVYLVVYVDDLLMTRNKKSYIASIKKDLKKIFEMKDMGHLHYYLGIEVTQHPKYIFPISEKICWRITKQILHDRMQPYLYSNGTKNEAHIKRRKRI